MSDVKNDADIEIPRRLMEWLEIQSHMEQRTISSIIESALENYHDHTSRVSGLAGQLMQPFSWVPEVSAPLFGAPSPNSSVPQLKMVEGQKPEPRKGLVASLLDAQAAQERELHRVQRQAAECLEGWVGTTDDPEEAIMRLNVIRRVAAGLLRELLDMEMGAEDGSTFLRSMTQRVKSLLHKGKGTASRPHPVDDLDE